LPTTPKWPNSKKDDNDDESEETKPVNKKVKPTKILEIISGMETALKQLKGHFEDCKRIEEINQRHVEMKWKRLEEYWGKLSCKLGEAGLS